MLIVFEGIDGSGKTTLTHAVKQRLESLGLKAVVTSELSRNDDWSVLGRKQLMSARNKQEQYRAVMLARLAHRGAVLDRLPETTIVLMDRYLPSTLAYQGCQTIPPGIMIGDHVSQHLPEPDMTFFIQLDPVVAHARAAHRGGRDAFDARSVDQYQETHNRFQSALSVLKDTLQWPYKALRGDQHLSTITEDCVNTIMELVRKASEGAAA